MIIEQKLDQILSDLELIKNNLKIIPDRTITITDFNTSILQYEEFAKEELKISQSTINNQKSTLLKFLNHSKGVITEESVKEYLESSNSDSWKSNQIKALRRYCRDYLKLGNWINEFSFSKSSEMKIKKIPTDEQLVEFCNALPSHISQIIFLIMHDSGLRIGEVVKLCVKDVNFETKMIDASEIHEGTTKHSYLSFVTEQTCEILFEYLDEVNKLEHHDLSVFDVSKRSIQKDFQNASSETGIEINPHLLRTVFTEKCTKAGVIEKYIDTFCGRTPKRIIAKHYSDYSDEAMRKQYDVVEPFLMLNV